MLAMRDDDLKVVVNIAVTVASVLTINDAQRSMTSSALIYIHWYDKALGWNTSDYNGIEWVEMTVDPIWTPLVYISNSLDKRCLLADARTVTIYHNGSVGVLVDRFVETLCDINLEKYPHDTQNCPLIFQSYQFPSFCELRVDTFAFQQSCSKSLSYSSEWYVESQRMVIVSLDGQDVPSVTLELRRKTTFYTMCLVSPMVLKSFMNKLVFLVPLQSGEKVSFLFSIFVSTSVFVSFFKKTTHSTGLFVREKDSTQRRQTAPRDRRMDMKVSSVMLDYSPPISTLTAGGDGSCR